MKNFKQLICTSCIPQKEDEFQLIAMNFRIFAMPWTIWLKEMDCVRNAVYVCVCCVYITIIIGCVYYVSALKCSRSLNFKIRLFDISHNQNLNGTTKTVDESQSVVG